MSPLAVCRLAPNCTRPVTGSARRCASDWNATRPPMVSAPSSTRRPPTPRMATVVSEASIGGTTPSRLVYRPSCCCATSELAWMPDQRAKKSSSLPLAFSVSIMRTPLIEVPASLPCSLRKRRLAFSRTRDTSRSASRFSSTMNSATRVSRTS